MEILLKTQKLRTVKCWHVINTIVFSEFNKDRKVQLPLQFYYTNVLLIRETVEYCALVDIIVVTWSYIDILISVTSVGEN